MALKLDVARRIRACDFDLRADVPPRSLRDLDIDGAGVTSLVGVGEMPDLEELVINPPGNGRLKNHVDLTPLESCRKLRRVILYRNGDLHNADVLTRLTSLERVMVMRGHIHPPLPPAPWLHTFD